MATVTLGTCPRCRDKGPLHGVCAKCHAAIYERTSREYLLFWALVALLIMVMSSVVWSLL